MNKIYFEKYSGAGNDFIILDRAKNPGLNVTSELVKNLCRRRMSIGADGLLVFSKSNGYDFELEYFNSDGSGGMLCGNGARCAVKYALANGYLQNESVFFCSNNSEYTAEVLSAGEIKFNLHPPRDVKKYFKIELENLSIPVGFVDVGAPHIVIFFDEADELHSISENFDSFPVEQVGRKIRFHKDFKPDGVNVNFVKFYSGVLKIRTYERGIEGETLSCGTGAVSAAILAALRYRIEPPINLLTKSGKILKVDFLKNFNKVKDISLTGPAEKIFSGYFTNFKNSGDIKDG